MAQIITAPKQSQHVTLLLRRPNTPEGKETFRRDTLTARDARWHVLTFGNKYNGATLQQIGSGEAEELVGESDGDGIRYLDWLLGQDWVAEYTRTAISKYLSHPTISRRLDLALAAKDQDGEPVLQSVGTSDPYELVPSCFTPSDEFDTSNTRWLGYRPGGRWVTKIKLSRANDADPTPAHWSTVGNLSDRDNGDDTVEGDDDGWVDFQLFEDDELWQNFQPKPVTLRNERDVWAQAERFATRFDNIAPTDAAHSADYLHTQVAAYNELRRETLATLTEGGQWFKLVDAACRKFLSQRILSAKGRLLGRAKSVNTRLNTIGGQLVVVQRESMTDLELCEVLMGFAAIMADTTPGIAPGEHEAEVTLPHTPHTVEYNGFDWVDTAKSRAKPARRKLTTV